MGWSGGRWGTNLTTEMNTNDIQDTATKAAQQGVKPHRLIKLGVDVHWGQSEGVNPLVAAGGRRTPEAGRFPPFVLCPRRILQRNVAFLTLRTVACPIEVP